jgi:hypothetical protein
LEEAYPEWTKVRDLGLAPELGIALAKLLFRHCLLLGKGMVTTKTKETAIGTAVEKNEADEKKNTHKHKPAEDDEEENGIQVVGEKTPTQGEEKEGKSRRKKKKKKSKGAKGGGQ